MSTLRQYQFPCHFVCAIQDPVETIFSIICAWHSHDMSSQPSQHSVSSSHNHSFAINCIFGSTTNTHSDLQVSGNSVIANHKKQYSTLWTTAWVIIDWQKKEFDSDKTNQDAQCCWSCMHLSTTKHRVWGYNKTGSKHCVCVNCSLPLTRETKTDRGSRRPSRCITEMWTSRKHSMRSQMPSFLIAQRGTLNCQCPPPPLAFYPSHLPALPNLNVNSLFLKQCFAHIYPLVAQTHKSSVNSTNPWMWSSCMSHCNFVPCENT